jgi:transposase
MVEKRAHKRGIPIIYVNPAYTSKRCSRCGEFGRRTRKLFECPHYGYEAHADVNAAFNIATSPLRKTGQENVLKMEEVRFLQQSKKQKMRRLLRCEPPVPLVRSFPQLANPGYYGNVLPVMD